MDQNSNNQVPIPPPIIFEKDNKAENITQDAVLDAINPAWCFGFNKLIGGVNLCINDSRKMFLASSHIGVVFDFNKNEQKLLQGHRNNISCVAVSEDKRWLLTADAGNDSTIIVWDLNTCLPVQTYYNTHLDGTIAVAFSFDSKYIATLSAQYPQVLAIWEWTTENETPLCTAELDQTFGLQTTIRFCPDNPFRIITNSTTQVLFFEWEFNKGLIYFAPTLNDETFNKPVGKLTQSIFQLQNNRALTGTTLGNLVVWQTVDNASYYSDKKAFKLFKLQDKPINVLNIMNEIIVIGDAEGHLKFIDQNLHVLTWYKHFRLGPINSISFTHTTKDFKNDVNHDETDATIYENKFYAKNFLITTTTAKIAYVTKTCTSIEVIMQGSESSVYGLTSHPSLPRIVFGNLSGTLQLWDYNKKMLICSRSFPKNLQISCLCYDHRGDFIAIGFKNGNLQIVDSVTLADVLEAPFSYAKDCITQIAFSADSVYMATAEADYTVSVYIRNYNKNANELYTILGRYKSHYKPIVGLVFGISPDSNKTRLLSLGQDRVLVEYDLSKSNFDDLKIKESTRIEQYATPLSVIWYPPINKESFILTFNDQWKYKLYNSTTKMCRKTLLGPTFGSLIKKLILIPKEKNITEKRYVAYITEDKLGLQKLPLTGNPFDSIAMFAHPNGVADLISSYDGKHLFTSGGVDGNLCMWKVNFESLEVQSLLGGTDLAPFYELLEGGRNGPLFKEMKELFYYSQLRHQGLNTNNERIIKTSIPLSEIPFVMRGLGFYPTEQEIEDMINEIKFSSYVDTNEYIDSIDLNDLIKLYINHRPAFGLDPYEIYNSFKILSKNKHNDLSRDSFLTELISIGEHLTEYELADCLTNLLNLNYTADELTVEEKSKLIDKFLPEKINVDTFMTHLMGIQKENFDEILRSWEEIRRLNSSNKPYRETQLTKPNHFDEQSHYSEL